MSSLELKQFDGSVLRLAEKPQRIVSLVPSVTESLIEWGVEPIARTSFCIFPKEKVKNILVIGGTKTPNLEKIIKIKPDLVIANKEENTLKDIEILRKEDIPVWVIFPNTPKEVVSYLMDVRGLCDASQYVRIDQDLLEVSECIDHALGQSVDKMRVAVLIWKDPWMLAGKETYISKLLEWVGLENAAAKEGSRYPIVEEGELLRSKLDMLILPTEPYAFSAQEKKSWEGIFKQSNQQTKVRIFPGEELTWQNLRIKKGLNLLLDLFSLPKVR